MSDPARSTDKYHGRLRLLDDVRGRSREWLNNKPIKPKYPDTADAEGQIPIVWSYDAKSQTLFST